MPDIRVVRHKMMIFLAVLLCVDLVAAGILLSPIGMSAGKHQQELKLLHADLRDTTTAVLPLRDIDAKIKQAKTEIDNFYLDRLPSQSSSIAEQLGRLANENGINDMQVRYEMDDSDLPDLRRVRIEATLGGSYLQDVKFINALERNKTFFLVDSISLGEEKAGIVRLQVKLETYLKNEAR